ncbi:MAG TPA: NAD(P)H-hydrate dehydratase [Methylomirabilota bacterium]|nr:NAD(P)H-hydrate dehydratase [Methylomirabilota bacterium]
MKALTAAEMREVDRLTTERFGIPGIELMEAAGKSVAEVFLEKYKERNGRLPGRVSVLCGKGNNGSDGIVVARLLKGCVGQVKLLLFAEPAELRGDGAKNYERWKGLGEEVELVRSESDWEKAWQGVAASEVIVDALLGTGIRGGASGLLAQVIENVNRFSQDAKAAWPAWIVAVDTPSGLPSDGEPAQGPVLRAHLTVTFTAPKIGQLVSADAGGCGALMVREIGTPAALVEEVGKGKLRWAGPEEFSELPLQRAVESHKGSYGHVLLVAGSVGKTGAAVLCGQAALRGGAGLVTLATPEPALATVAAAQAEYMTEALPATASGTIASEAARLGGFATLLHGMTVLGIGPGIGTHPETQEFVRSVVTHADLPIVLDADGLNAFAGQAEILSNRKSAHLVMTPHPGEMARLCGFATPEVQADRIRIAVEFAGKWNAVVLLKGYHTVIAAPNGDVFVNTTGNAGLAKGGSGDVLTGLLAALIAQFGAQDLYRVVALGAYLHGRAAELVSAEGDESGVLAGEVARAVPAARRKLLQELQARG